MRRTGKYTYGHNRIEVIGHGCSEQDVEIGSFSSIGQCCKVYMNNGRGHYSWRGTTYPFGEFHYDVFNNGVVRDQYENRKVTIGSDVWIGHDVSINPGITIGDGAIVATRSHVVRDVPPYAIVGGNPAKLIKYRFDKETVEKFLQLKWWDLPDHEINAILPLIRIAPEKDTFMYIERILSMIRNQKNDDAV